MTTAVGKTFVSVLQSLGEAGVTLVALLFKFL